MKIIEENVENVSTGKTYLNKTACSINGKWLEYGKFKYRGAAKM